MDLIRTCMAVIFHPVDTFEFVIYTREKRKNYVQSIILLFLVVLTNILTIYITHIPLAKVQPRDANLIVEISKRLVPIFTWTVACYGVTSIMDGETNINQTLVAAAYSMTPYILFSVPLALFTNILSGNQIALYNYLLTAIWIWVILLYFISLQRLNDYSFAKAVGVSILALVGMIIILAVIMLFFALTNQLWSFIKDMQLEIKILWLDRM